MGQEQDGKLNSLVTTRPEHMRRSKLVFQVAQAGAHEKIEVVQVAQRRLSGPPRCFRSAQGGCRPQSGEHLKWLCVLLVSAVHISTAGITSQRWREGCGPRGGGLSVPPVAACGLSARIPMAPAQASGGPPHCCRSTSAPSTTISRGRLLHPEGFPRQSSSQAESSGRRRAQVFEKRACKLALPCTGRHREVR